MSAEDPMSTIGPHQFWRMCQLEYQTLRFRKGIPHFFCSMTTQTTQRGNDVSAAACSAQPRLRAGSYRDSPGAGGLSAWLGLARRAPRAWQLSEHPSASQAEHPISRVDAPRCRASEADVNPSVTPSRAGTRPCTCCARTAPTDSSGRSAPRPNSCPFRIFKQVPTCFALLNLIF